MYFVGESKHNITFSRGKTSLIVKFTNKEISQIVVDEPEKAKR